MNTSGRSTVGLGLMKSEEGEAVVAYLRATYPQLRIQDRGTFLLVESEDEISVELDGVSEYLGREISMAIFLVTMTTFYGRVQVSDDRFLVTSELLELEEDRAAP